MTREPFLFYEMRTVSRLLETGMDRSSIVETIAKQNLFQYPTERSSQRMAKACLARIGFLPDAALVPIIASGLVDEAKQACLYALMRQYRLVLDFMVTVVGEKFRTMDLSWGPSEAHNFLTRLREQNESVAEWSESTTREVRRVLVRTLMETGYLSGLKASSIEPVTIYPSVENVIRAAGDMTYLSAFNCFV
ncbi:DUF1819 family protein [Fibrobacter sp. UWH3]|uniref:DUF1819 family protein n=1 Tax=Fibrobacter sp. UWH3 TaxID=1964353 RepID=UPI001BAF1AF7|nr:DUF1819 family protein [Fibrobacter sp. UWH3]